MDENQSVDQDMSIMKVKEVASDVKKLQKVEILKLASLVDQLEQKYNCKKEPTIPRYLRSIWKNCSYWSEALAAPPVNKRCTEDCTP